VLQGVLRVLRTTGMTEICPLSKISRPKTLSLISGVSKTLDRTPKTCYINYIKRGESSNSLRYFCPFTFFIMQFKCQNANHPFTTCAFYPPELTDGDKVLAKKILEKYPQFRSFEVNDFDLYVLGEVTDRSNPLNVKKVDRDAIERNVLGMFYKFYRRTLSIEFEEKLHIDSFMEYIYKHQVVLVEKIDPCRFLGGTQSLIEDKLHYFG